MNGDKKNMERLYIETDEGEVKAVWVDKRVLKALGYEKEVWRGFWTVVYLVFVAVSCFIFGAFLAFRGKITPF